ncbi:MAG: PorP/SprF family type IX secretion system membrane protein [Cytophagales bacterium]|nr:PorP/SprF family type IX secretion system membrane protein [Cytophagales bacterium]
MKNIIFYLIIFISVTHIAYAQLKPIYNNYLLNEIIINPAYAGSANALSASLSYRNQWSGVAGPAIETYNIAAHTPMMTKYFATGAIVTHDKIGYTATTDINICAAGRLKINKYNIALGAQAGYTSVRQNFDLSELKDADDPAFINAAGINALKYGIGIHLAHKKYFFSYSLPAFTTHDKLYNSGALQHYIMGGYILKLNDIFTIKPSILIKYVADGTQYDLNTLVQISRFITIGGQYRVADALVALAQLKLTRQLGLGYAYEYSFNSLKNYASIGTHEILLRYDFKYSVNDINVKTFY